jgi:hypothetical protein
MTLEGIYGILVVLGLAIGWIIGDLHTIKRDLKSRSGDKP